MINKTNFMAVAIIAAAAFTAAPAANATVAAGMSAATAASTTAATTTAPAGIVLAHGYGGHWHGGWLAVADTGAMVAIVFASAAG